MVRALIRYAPPAVLGDDIGIAAHQIYRRIRALLNYLSYHRSFLPQSFTSPSMHPSSELTIDPTSPPVLPTSRLCSTHQQLYRSLNTKILACFAYIQHVDIRGVPCLIHRCMAACLTVVIKRRRR